MTKHAAHRVLDLAIGDMFVLPGRRFDPLGHDVGSMPLIMCSDAKLAAWPFALTPDGMLVLVWERWPARLLSAAHTALG